MKKYLIFSLLIASVLACENPDTPIPGAGLAFDENEMIPITVRKIRPEQVERKLIYSADIRYESDNLDSSRKQVSVAVKSLNAYISSDEAREYDGGKIIYFKIRVPQKNFYALIQQITNGVSSFDEKSIEVEDVSEKFIDLNARLKSKKNLEQKYTELLEKATTVSEILEIERELGKLREDIESFEGKQRYLSHQVDYSTLSVSIYNDSESQFQSGKKFKSGIAKGWENLLWFFVFLTHIWPFVLIALVIGAFIRWRYRKKRERVKDQSS